MVTEASTTDAQSRLIYPAMKIALLAPKLLLRLLLKLYPSTSEPPCSLVKAATDFW